MFVTQERLEMLKAQREHLLAMWTHCFTQHVHRLGKASVPNDGILEAATTEADAEFREAGLNMTAIRIRLELAYLEDELVN